MRALYVMMVGALTLGAAQAEEIRLRGTVRDFSQSHIDMENEHAVDPGIVRMRLGDDGRPVYGDHVRTLTTHGQAAFDEWYRDVPGVNQAAPLVLTLTNSPADPEVFVFTDLDFFPIDDRMGGNEGHPHNYHFTLEMHTRFVYEGGERLTFEGDDDLWVFINGHLAIDLGGVHGALSETADFDAIAGAAGMVPGEIYTLDIFFAERALVASHFTLSTTARTLDQVPDDDPGGDPGGENGLEDCIDDPACVIPCNNGECPLNLMCVDEQCVDPCAGVACLADEICVDGACTAAPDGGVDAGMGGAGGFAPPPPLVADMGLAQDSDGGGCRSSGGDGSSGWGWALMVVALMRWRR